MSPFINTIVLWLLLVLPSVCFGLLLEQPHSLEQLESKKKTALSDSGLTDDHKSKLNEFYEQAIDSFRQTKLLKDESSRLEEQVQAGPRRISDIEKEIINIRTSTADSKPISKLTSIEKIEQKILEQEASLYAAQETVKKYQDELSRLSSQSFNFRDELSDRSKRIENIESDLAAEPISDEHPSVTAARKTALLAKKQFREEEIRQLRLQYENKAFLIRLASAELSLATEQTTTLQRRLSKLHEIGQKYRENQASETLEQAELIRQRVADMPEAIKNLASEHLVLSAELEQLVVNEADLLGQLQSIQNKHDSIKTLYSSTRRRVEVAGSTDAIGRMLRKRLSALPSVHAFKLSSKDRRNEISLATDRQIDIDELRSDLNVAGDQAQALIDSLSTDETTESVRAQWLSETANLFHHRERLFNELYNVYGRYISALTALDSAERQLVSVSDEFVTYIKEQLLWIRSAPPVSVEDSVKLLSGAAWLASPINWFKVSSDLFKTFKGSPLPWIMGAAFISGLLLLRQRSKRIISASARLTVKVRTDKFKETLRVFFYTVTLAAGWPVLFCFSAWWLKQSPTADPFSISVSNGLVISACVLFVTELFRQMCRKDGLAARHFRWPDNLRIRLRYEFHWFVITATLLSFVVAMVGGTMNPSQVAGVGRPAFIVLMVCSVVFIYRIMRSAGPVTKYLNQRSPNHWFTQLRIFWFSVLLLIPICLIFISSMGYHHSALHISERLLGTVFFFFGLLLTKELIFRWLYVEQRRLRFEDAVRKREEAREKQLLDDGETSPDQSQTLPIIEEPEVDYGELSEQAKRLLKTGLLIGAFVGVWSIWSGLLPALGFLDNVHLPFTANELVDGVEKTVPVTLADLGSGLLIAFITIFAAKNLPGILEIALLQRLPLDSGGRYAFTTLSQYTIVAIGIIATFTMIGAEWSSIQWLVAALSVGLGFGLQEIFANFISGLIILFERPVRVGDSVTVADLSGKVSRIQIRATTITDWDRKEIIVPNKNFITERLINWTLTDPITRVVIPIGVAYGSNTTLAYEVISEAAEKHPLVLKEPKQQLFFLGFGDSSLNFELRVFVRQMDDRLPVTHDLHMAINEALKENNIEIPFPQRDIHIRSGLITPER